jgi:hypothetical protein
VEKLDHSNGDLWSGFEVLFRMIRRLSRFPFQPDDVEDHVDFEGFMRALSLLLERLDCSLPGAATFDSFGTYQGYLLRIRPRLSTDFHRMIFRSLAQVYITKTTQTTAKHPKVETCRKVPVISFQTNMLILLNREEEDWYERVHYFSRWEDERSIDALDVLSLVHASAPGFSTSTKPHRSLYEHGLHKLPVYKYYLDELTIPYDDLINLASIARALKGYATHFDDEEDEEEDQDIDVLFRGLSDLRNESKLIDWVSFDNLFAECDVSLLLLDAIIILILAG